MLSAPPKTGPHGRLQLHASTVVINGNAVAFTGPAGSGKSGHALACLARGAVLLADDITWLEATGAGLIAHCPDTIIGQIEARGIGILNAPTHPPAPLTLIVDLGTHEPERLPDPKFINLLGHNVRLFHNPETAHFADAIYHYMVHGLID